ncbi:hypothetical protein SAMN05661096_04130 [Marivirga sericea]|uniref:Uncharacterized protein n=1 Tax=Marivirga sericea TaxID=1028 RepID=A0A1X7LKC6_9BACT|nr:hypothetical protein [Marivirga sericea]SMG54235.1 hypothetical protein SAMN05661096_04130 [Marivirga sericea]
MNKIIQTLLVLTLFACSSDKQTNHGESEKTTPLQSENEEAKKVVQAETTTEDLNPQVAVDFINSYVDNPEKMGDRIEIREWTRNSELVTDYFKTELDKMITEAYEREPE